MGRRETRGLTLIELLLVVSLVAALAMLALPNLLLAQVRSKVARTEADLRTLSLGVEMYKADYNHFPDSSPPKRFKVGMEYSSSCLNRITTPVAYLTGSNLKDTFTLQYPLVYVNIRAQAEQVPSIVDIFVPGISMQQKAELARSEYVLAGVGPDGMYHSQLVGDATVIHGFITKTDSSQYDPTNGTVSPGDIARTALGAR